MAEQQTNALFPAWGPYSKTYMGISHIPALAAPGAALPLAPTMEHAARFDCVVVPGLHSSFQPMPNTTTAGTCHPFADTTPGFDRVHYRWELGEGPGEAAHADVRFARLDQGRVLVRTDFVNNTHRTLDCVLNCFFTLDYPYERITRARLRDGVVMVAGQDHAGVRFSKPRPWDHQQPDATRAGVFRDPDFTDGFGFGDRVSSGHVPHLNLQPFGAESGDSVEFDLPFSADKLTKQGLALGIRYRTVPLRPKDGIADFAREATGIMPKPLPKMDSLGLVLSGAAQCRLTLQAAEEMALAVLEPGKDGFSWGEGSRLTLCAMGADCGLEIDCLLLGTRKDMLACAFEQQALLPAPVEVKAGEGGYEMAFPALPARYRYAPYAVTSRLRMLHSGCLEDAEPMRVSNPHFTFDDLHRPFSASFPRKASKPGLWVNLVMGDLVVAAGSTRTVYGLLAFVEENAPPFEAASGHWMQHLLGRPGLPLGDRERALFDEAFAPLPEALPDAPQLIQTGMGILRATLLQNLVYPIYTKAGWIAHFTPGKRWDNLYTWDGGFIALGLLTQRRALCEYMLDLYLAPPDDPEQAFVHHGSPVPVQWMALRELVALSPEAEQLRLLRRYYARARMFYAFLMGRTHGSTTMRFKSGLPSTYDYFYSAHGMDDYPAQLISHLKGVAGRVAPAITASQAMLGARTLTLLGQLYARLDPDEAEAIRTDLQAYQQDVSALTRALEQFSWDEKSGCYSYVLHDDAGEPAGFLRDEGGHNLNQGFDGLYPLAALGAEAPHRERLLQKLKDERALLTPYGLTAVSRSAPYFMPNGYWNGAVWYPHAWYFGKALLDLCEGDFLAELLDRQLNAWSHQAKERWNSYEMLRLSSGEGAWHPTFSGLTSPLLNWAYTRYLEGTVTTGLSCLALSFEEQGGHARLRLTHLGETNFMVWLTTDKGYDEAQAWQIGATANGVMEVLLVLSASGQAAALPPQNARPLSVALTRPRPGLLQAAVRVDPMQT